ncbi:MAG: WXG100 family type VII secretion target [Actinomycetota bacterium]|nr:WXG100 family type VII secretion target [Actinomycetota bacterium]
MSGPWASTAGDAASCSALAARMLSAARDLAREEEQLGEVATGVLSGWEGPAADAFDGAVCQDAHALRRLADGYAEAGRALQAFAEQLAQMQSRMAAVVRAAEVEGLHVERDGSVTMPPGPYPTLRFERLVELRTSVTAEVEGLESDARLAHRTLVRTLDGVRELAHAAVGR